VAKGHPDETKRASPRNRWSRSTRRTGWRRHRHREHGILGNGIDPARPRLRLAGAPVMPSPPRPDPAWASVLLRGTSLRSLTERLAPSFSVIANLATSPEAWALQCVARAL